MAKRLSKADIRSRAATKTKVIRVPEWDAGKDKAEVVIKAWSIADRDMILNEIKSRLSGVQISTLAPQICAVSLVDGDGELMYGDEEGVAELRTYSHEGLIRVMDAAYHFNGLGVFATDDEGAALRKKAEDDTDSASATPSDDEAEDPKN